LVVGIHVTAWQASAVEAVVDGDDHAHCEAGEGSAAEASVDAVN